MGPLENPAGANDELDKLDAMMVGGQRRISGEDGMRHGFDHRLVEVEELVDDKAGSELSVKQSVLTVRIDY